MEVTYEMLELVVTGAFGLGVLVLIGWLVWLGMRDW